MLINYNEQIEILGKIRRGEMQEGLKLDIPELDNYIRFKPSNFNICLGHANVGKTTTILYLMLLWTAKDGKRWLIYSSENEPYGLIRKMIEFINKKPIHLISEEKYEKSVEFINQHFKFISAEKTYNYKDLISLGMAVKDAWEYDGFLIDPYNSLVKEHELMKTLGGHEYDYQATTEMRMFCKRYKVSIWLCTHAVTQALRFKHSLGHEYAGYPIPPSASDVEGGGKFVNRADDFIVIHRYTQHPTEWMISQIHVRKVKEIETGGRPTPMDEPIKLRSIVNNVGFEISGEDLLDKILAPF